MPKVAMLVGPEFEDSEAAIPLRELKKAGHEVELVGKQAGETVHGKRGEEDLRIERAARDANPDDYDALVIPGGHSPDHLRTDEAVVSFVREFARSGKTVAAVCHGPQLLIEADVVDGKTMTSWPSVRKDLENAGVRWVDQEVCEDGAFITSRKPDDLEAFSKAVLERLRTLQEAGR